MSDVGKSLHRLERQVLTVLEKKNEANEIAEATRLKNIEVMRALQWLSNKKLVEIAEESKEYIFLETNGRKAKEEGLPERKALKLLTKNSQTASSLTAAGIDKSEINIIIGSLKKKAAINIEKKNGELTLSITAAGKQLAGKQSLEEQFLAKDFPLATKELAPEEEFALKNLQSRKAMLKKETKKTVRAELTAQGKKLIKTGISQEVGIDKLTPAMLKNGNWRKKEFRPYDVEINVPKINRGKKHFVNEAMDYVKKIWMDLGFEEMSGTHIQTSFWDLDSLFVPQDHPAREMQDTFYIKKPKRGNILDKESYARVKKAHENGGDTGSKGWQAPFDEELAKKNLLRTHTTVVSAQTLAAIKEKIKKGEAAKFFIVGKVYRNEALDWKHLFEFHQVDGIVIDPNANLRHLKGYLTAFYKKMGFEKVRMRPAHFPYTEPSIEPEVWHPVKKEWIEMGGAGIFRPEVTKTLLGIEVPVLAWGLGLERIISPYFGITDIRELYQNDLKQIRRMKNFIK